ncbi:MAG: CARDB domain-containing protein, partial [Longimicrobiales bacterium]|nr:CARDB domain-containing protein [Longimicrobiales bacterium]
LASCGGGSTTTEVEDPVPTTMELSTTSVGLRFLGQTQRVTVTVRDQNGAIIANTTTWASLDESVATVTPTGVVRAVGNGATTVEATAGTLSRAVDVSVEQVPSFIQALSGNNQDGLAGTQLSDPIVAIVRDQGGAPVEGIEVTFTPGENSGSVDPTSGLSAADGTVSTTWTLDAKFGPQTAVAAIDVDDVVFNAFGGSGTPTPDLLLSDPIRVVRSDPTSLDSVEVTATVFNQGDADAIAFRVRLLVDAVEVGAVDVLGLAAGAEEEVVFEVEPMVAGTRALEVVVDAEDAVLELDETNNTGERELVVELQQVIDPGTTVSALSADAGEQFLFRVDVGSTPTNLTIQLGGGTGDVDLWVEGGDRPPRRDLFDDCISDGPTMSEKCQIPGATGFYHISVYAPVNPPGAPSGFTNSSLTVTTGDPVEGFDLELVFIDNGTPSQDQAFRDAADVWNGIIIGDIPDFDLGSSQIDANACIDGQPAVRGVIDDVIIYVAIRAIDGPMGTLARAGPCAIRNGSSLTYVGVMEFDQADLDRLELNGDMEAVVLHEMGHVLGIGTIWVFRDLLRAPSTDRSGGSCTVANPDADTHFTGQLARN